MVPVGIGRGEGVVELRGPTVELARGSARAEEGCSGGSAVASSLPGLRVERRRCSGVCGLGDGKRAKGTALWGSCSTHACERSERRALQRARHRSGEVAATQAVLSGVARGEGTRARQEAVVEVRSDVWTPARSRRWPAGPPRRAAALHNGGGRR